MPYCKQTYCRQTCFVNSPNFVGSPNFFVANGQALPMRRTPSLWGEIAPFSFTQLTETFTQTAETIY